MAGFSDSAGNLVGLRMLPHPAVAVGLDFGDGLLVEDASGQRKIGIVAIGLAPGTVWVGGRDIECLQVRLSPVVAHAVLGACRELGGTVVALDVLWGHDAVRIQEQLRAAGTWADRCGTPTRNSPTRLTC